MLIPTKEKKERSSSPLISVQKKPSLFNSSSIRFAGFISLVYLALSYFLVGLKTDQFVLLLIFNGLYFGSRATRRFISAFSIFIIYWIIFDWMKAFPNYRFNSVHIEALYNFEKALFGFEQGQTLVTPNEYFALHHAVVADVLAGLFYLCWVPVPLAFAGFLYVRNRRYFFQFSLTFLVVNLIGFAGYYLYPAAPPWYVAENGFVLLDDTPGNTAGLGRFDVLTGTSIFKSIYAKSSNVFAAMPSLHAAYMLIVLVFGIKLRMRAWNILFALIMCGIWFAAVYSGHHYILDVLAGIGCALSGIGLFDWFCQTVTGEKMLKKLMRITEK